MASPKKSAAKKSTPKKKTAKKAAVKKTARKTAARKAPPRKAASRKPTADSTLRSARIQTLGENLRKTRPVTPPAKLAEPPKLSFFQEAQGELPRGYGDHFIYLMICAPYQLYAYWEIQPGRQQEALAQLGGGWDRVRSILRIYNLSLDPQGGSFFDIEIGGGADNWFIDVEPDQAYAVEIGLLHDDGRFAVLARSNTVMTPRVTMSSVLDEEWMSVDFDRMYALSGGFEPGKSSEALQQLMIERLRHGVTSGSGGFSSGSVVKKKDRHFWFELNCELIVYGATVPDAAVTVNGQKIRLRPDGTFTLRYALPDGNIRLEAQAVSPDKVEKRRIIPEVTRQTQRPEPVIRPSRRKG